MLPTCMQEVGLQSPFMHNNISVIIRTADQQTASERKLGVGCLVLDTSHFSIVIKFNF